VTRLSKGTLYKAGIRHVGKSVLAAISRRRTRPFGPPLAVSLGFSTRCNCRCLYCDVWRRNDHEELDTASWREILAELAAWLGPTHVSFAGGEPFLRADLGELVAHAHGLRLLPSIVTNASVLSSQMIQEVAQWPLVSLVVSIDSHSSEPHDILHGVLGSHAKAMNAVRQLADIGFGGRLRISAVLTALNMDELVPLAAWSAENGIGGFTIQPFGEPFERDHSDDWYAASPLRVEQPGKITEIAEQLKVGKRHGWPILNPDRQLDALPSYYRNPERGLFLPCPVGTTALGIGPLGELRFCPYMPAFGSAGQQAIRDQWFGKNAAQLRKAILRCRRGCSIMNCSFSPTVRERISRWRRLLR
jgi:MoaA/NifB/PqqE/SkfB family radical SAM enzyme